MTTTTSTGLVWSRPARVAMILVFLVIIALPGVDSFLHISPQHLLREKREGAPFPPRGVLDPPAFEKAYNDRFGFREALVYGHNWIDIHLFHVSPTKRVLLGNDGWLYLNDSIDDHRGLVKLSPRVMEAWRRGVAAKAAYFAEHGIVYLLVIAPNKESIYPEFLPMRIRQVEHENSFDQLEHYLEGRMPCDLLDLRPPLLAEKRAHGTKLFLKTDTHWNQSGALLAAQEIVARLRRVLPDIPLLTDDEYRRTPKNLHGGDLAQMIGFPKSRGERDTALDPQNLPPQTFTHSSWAPSAQFSAWTAESESPSRVRRAVISGDSFGIALAPLLAPQFRRLAYTMQLVDPKSYTGTLEKIIEAEHPDVVIELFTERNLLRAERTVISPKP